MDYRRHLHDVVHGCRELATCEAVDAAGGGSLRGVHITLRMRLQCEVWRGGRGLEESFEVLNEVVLSRGANPYLSKIEVRRGGAEALLRQARTGWGGSVWGGGGGGGGHGLKPWSPQVVHQAARGCQRQHLWAFG
jgi:hypothetical protein